MTNLDIIIAIEEFIDEKGLPKTITVYDLLGEIAEDALAKTDKQKELLK